MTDITEQEKRGEFTLDMSDGDPDGPPFPDCHCGRWVGDDKGCSGCGLHPLDCSCLSLEEQEVREIFLKELSQ